VLCGVPSGGQLAYVTVGGHSIRGAVAHGNFLKRSKTDQYKEGAWTLVARVGGPFCPVGLVERLVSLAQYSGSGPLTRSVVVTRNRQYAKAAAPAYSTLCTGSKRRLFSSAWTQTFMALIRAGAGAPQAQRPPMSQTVFSNSMGIGAPSAPRIFTSSIAYVLVCRSTKTLAYNLTCLCLNSRTLSARRVSLPDSFCW
jgi:hypothetical protein